MATYDMKGRAGGFSLVELMVGMLLGTMLIGGAVSIYLASKRSYVEVEQVADLSENAVFADHVLSDAVRHAGFFGEVTAGRVEMDSSLSTVVGDCTGSTAAPTAANAYNVNFHVFAVTADSSGNAMNCITDAVPNTDVLVIKYAIPQPYSDGPRDVFDPNDLTQGDGVIDTPQGLQADKVYVMTNNLRGIIFDGADTPPTITTGGDVPAGVAWEFRYEAYYVRDIAGNTKAPQLSRKVLAYNGSAMSMTTEDVVEGVENMHFLFGYDSAGNGEVDTYRNAASMSSADWAMVDSIEAYLLLRSTSEDPQYRDDKTYTLGDLAPIDPNQPVIHFRRLVNHSSLSMRNLKLVVRGGA